MDAVPKPRARDGDDPVQAQIEYLGTMLAQHDQHTLSHEAVSDAVAAGLHRAVSSPEFWTAAMRAMGAHTKTAAGGFLVQSISGAIKKVLLFLTVGLMVYSVGGWTGLSAAFKAIFGFDGMKP